MFEKSLFWSLLATVTLTAVGLASLPADAADVTSTWDGTTGNWTDFARWSSNPLYPNNGNGGFTYDAVINTGSVTQDLAAGITIEQLIFGGGTIEGDYDLTANGIITWTAGTMSGAGTTYANGGMSISGSNHKWCYRRLVNAGTATWSGSGKIIAAGSMVFDNLSGAMFDVQNDNQYWNYHNGATFNNAGTFRKSAGTGTTAMEAAFNNTGAVEVQTGTVQFTGGGTHTGTFNVSSGATLQFGGGVHTLNTGSTVSGDGNVVFNSGTVNLNDAYSIAGTTTFSGGATTFNVPFDAGPGAAFDGSMVTFNEAVSNLPADLVVNGGAVNFNGNSSLAFDTITASGGVGGTADITVSGLYTLTGGSAIANGTTGTGTTYANGALNISGSNHKWCSRNIVNAGTATWSGTGKIAAAGSMVFDNLSGATFDVQNDILYWNYSYGATFNNAGTFRKSAGTGTTTMEAAFNNTGAVEVQTGTVNFTGGGTHTGTFNISPAATLQFGGGTHTLNTGSTVSGDGNVIFFSGAVNLNDTYSITGTTTFSGGAATFNVPFDVGPGAAFDGSTVTFNEAVSNLPADLVVNGGSVNFNGNASLAFDTITASGGVGGTADITVSGLYALTGGSPASNGTTGTGTTYANGGMSISSSSDFIWCSRHLVNAGTATWTGSGHSFVAAGSMVFDNLFGATFDVQNDATYWNYHNGATFNNAGTFRKSAGTGTTTMEAAFNNTGAVEVQTGTVNFTGGGTHTGTFNISPAATLQFGGGVHTLNTGSTVSGDGNVVFNSGTVNLNDAYSIAGT